MFENWILKSWTTFGNGRLLAFDGQRKGLTRRRLLVRGRHHIPAKKIVVYTGKLLFCLYVCTVELPLAKLREGEYQSSVADPGCLSRIPDRNFSIRDPILFHPGSRIRIKNLSILTQKNFLSSRKYDPGYSSRVRILIFLPIPDNGSRGQKGTGSRIRNTGSIYIVHKSVQPNFHLNHFLSTVNAQMNGLL
jgi:hypothetical protein